jgi:hypothetical protein
MQQAPEYCKSDLWGPKNRGLVKVWVHTCVTAPASTAQLAVAGVPVRVNAKKAPPNSISTVGVMKAAVAHPMYWKINLPLTISAIVTYPVAIDTSASTPCEQHIPNIFRVQVQESIRADSVARMQAIIFAM